MVLHLKDNTSIRGVQVRANRREYELWNTEVENPTSSVWVGVDGISIVPARNVKFIQVPS